MYFYTYQQVIHKQAIRHIIKAIGDNPERKELEKTSERVVKSWNDLFYGYKVNLDEVFTTFWEQTKVREMVIVKDIDFNSFCEHHMLPFYGTVHIGYIPKYDESRGSLLAGLSKFPRLVQAVSAKLQIQERLTEDISRIICDKLNPIGSGVVIESSHHCVSCRGIRSQSKTVTSSLSGCFREHQVRDEFFTLIGK